MFFECSAGSLFSVQRRRRHRWCLKTGIVCVLRASSVSLTKHNLWRSRFFRAAWKIYPFFWDVARCQCIICCPTCRQNLLVSSSRIEG